MYVKPAPNPAEPGHVLLVRVPPHMAPMPVDGANVPDTMFWHRALLRGDVLLADSPDVTAENASKAEAAKEADAAKEKAAQEEAHQHDLTEAAEAADAAAKTADAAAAAANEAAGHGAAS